MDSPPVPREKGITFTVRWPRVVESALWFVFVLALVLLAMGPHVVVEWCQGRAPPTPTVAVDSLGIVGNQLLAPPADRGRGSPGLGR